MKTKFRVLSLIMTIAIILSSLVIVIPANAEEVEDTYPVSDGTPWTDYAADAFAGGDGSKENPYQIANAEQLALLAKLINDTTTCEAYAKSTYILTDDIDLGGHEWVSIAKTANTTYRFFGTLDGNGKTIANLTYTNATTVTKNGDTVGLFGYVGGNQVAAKNFKLTGRIDLDTVTYAGQGAAIAFVVSHASGWSVYENIDVDGTINVINSVTEPGVGGIMGNAHSGIIRNCTMSGSVTVSVKEGLKNIPIAGGFVGTQSKGLKIYDSVNFANVAVYANGSNSIAGGFVAKCGYIAETGDDAFKKEFGTYIEGCVNYGHISSNVATFEGAASPNNQRVGGFIGNIGRAAYSSAKTYMNVDIIKCIHAGKVSVGKGVTVGGSSSIFPVGHKEGSGKLTVDQFFVPVFEDAESSSAIGAHMNYRKFGDNSDIRMAIETVSYGDGTVAIRVSKNAVDTFLGANFNMLITYGEETITALGEEPVIAENGSYYEFILDEVDGVEATMTMSRNILGNTYTYTADKATWSDFYKEAFTGSGSEADPFYIDSAEKLGYLSDYVARFGGTSGKYFVIAGEIDLGAHDWLPIGIYTHPGSAKNYWLGDNYNACGILMGDGAVIKNVKLTADRYNYSQSFFGYSSWSTISDLTFDGFYVEDATLVKGTINAVGNVIGSQYAATADGVEISNVHVKNYQLVSDGATEARYYGGIVGYLGHKYATVSDCSVQGTAEITSDTVNRLGGIVSRSRFGEILNCVSDIDVVVNTIGVYNVAVGGILGMLECNAVSEGANQELTTITNCYNKGDVTLNVTADEGSKRIYGAGGIVGIANNHGDFRGKLVMSDCVNTGKIAVNDLAGLAAEATYAAGDIIGLNAVAELEANANYALGGKQAIGVYAEIENAATAYEGGVEAALNLKTAPKARVRLDVTDYANTGLRFDSSISLFAYDSLVEAVGEDGYVMIGTIILPTDMLEAYNYDLDEIYANEALLEIPYDQEFYMIKGDDTAMFSGAIVNLNPANIDRQFSAISYIMFSDGGEYTHTIYGDYSIDGARSALEVAQKAYDDPEGGYTDEQLAALVEFYGVQQ